MKIKFSIQKSIQTSAPLLVAIAIALVTTFSFTRPARADGIIIPNPPLCEPRCKPLPPCPPDLTCPTPTPVSQLVIRYHRVQVTIHDQVATTRVDQVFYNPNSWDVEGTYLFPLPGDAAVSSFTLWIDDQPVKGEILEAEAARQKYQEIVTSLRDPALLEYAGRGAMQAQIFPIPSQGERRIELEYSQALTAENGLVHYVYPLNTEKFSAWPLENVTVNVEIDSSVPLRAVYSPSHNVDIQRESENLARVGYEDTDILPDQDFNLYYSLGETEAFHLLTFRDPNDLADPDGFFLLLLAPRPDAAQNTQPKDIFLVLDRSGSMEGDKFRQAQDALGYILQHLNSEDRFNVLAFSTRLEIFANQLQPASAAPDAQGWVDGLSAQGSTDINRALLEAVGMVDRERPTYLIFLTDGLPTEGVIESQQILTNLQKSASENVRLFAFGVGYDVDTLLLDSLAQEHHGTSTYVLPGERLDEILSSFYAKISTPVLTDLALDIQGISTYDLYPSPLPDLFAGSQIVLVGRYRQAGSADLRLIGNVNGQVQTFRLSDQIFNQDSDVDSTLSVLPRLWATRKIGYLLSQLRLDGPDQETIDQVVRLSIRYGIVTPYTSYLVTEEMPLGAQQQEQISNQAYSQMETERDPPSSGEGAVQKAADQGSMAAAEAPAAPTGESASQVKIVGSRTFVFNTDKWIDTAFDPDSMQTLKVAFLSDDYFALAATQPELASAFALGQNVIAILAGKAYEVVPAEVETSPLDILSPVPTAASSMDDLPTETLEPAESLPAVSPTGEPIAPGTLPCMGGLLPLFLLLMRIVFQRINRA